MVKTLRNRQIDVEMNSRPQNSDKMLPIIQVRTPHTIKKTILRKLNSGALSFRRQKRFLQTIEQGSFSTILDESRLQCPICLELMVQPTMMICGHMYCFRCLDSNAAYSQRCCLCRQQQMDAPHIPSRFAENMINKFLLPRSNQVIHYLCRATDSNQWLKHRLVRHVRPGQIVDFHDSLCFWQKAVIVKSFLDKSGKAFVVVKTNVKGEERTETVEMSSKRLAPAKFFTKGRYLEDFLPFIPEYDYQQRQLNSLEYREEALDEGFFTSLYRHEQQFLMDELQQNSSSQHQAHIQDCLPSPTENFLDEALILFDMEMRENDLEI